MSDEAMSRSDFIKQASEGKLPPEYGGNTPASAKAEDTELEEDELEDEIEDLETDSDEDDPEDEDDEEVVSKEEFDKVNSALEKARKNETHYRQLLRAHKIDPKSSAKDAKAIAEGKESYEGPSAREVRLFNSAVKNELRAKGFPDELSELLVSQFDVTEFEDDDYINDRVEEVVDKYGAFLKKNEDKPKTRKTRSDLGKTHDKPQVKKLNSTQARLKAVGMI